MITIKKVAFICVFLFLPVSIGDSLWAQLSSYKHLTYFTKERKWESAQGTKVTGKLICLGCNGEAEIELVGGQVINLMVGQLSKSDQDHIKSLRLRAYTSASERSQKLGTAKEIRDLYQKLWDDGLVPDHERDGTQIKLEELKRQAHIGSIKIRGGYVTRQELAKRKKEAQTLIDQWIADSNKAYTRLKKGETIETKQVKAAIQKDPTSVEGVLLLSLLYGLRESNLKSEERKLTNAVAIGQRYARFASNEERFNIAGVYNNLAVNRCRRNQIGKALKNWELAAGFADPDINDVISENLARLQRFAQNESEQRFYNTGLSASTDELESLSNLRGQFTPVQGNGGWKLVCPKDFGGNVRDNMPFILAPRTVFMAQVIGDHRCLRCYGVGRNRCPFSQCKGGKVEVEVIGPNSILYPDGSRQRLPLSSFKGTFWVTCPRCGGEIVRCPSCGGSGVQR